MNRIIDLTYTYETGMTVGKPENHPTVELTRMGKIEEKGFNTSSMLLGSHIGTHMDAPRHLLADGATIESVDLSSCMGDACVVDFSYITRGQCVEINDVKGIDVKKCMIFVFGWGWFFDTPQYSERWPYFTPEAAEYLVEKGMRLMALDVMSPDCKATGNGEDFQVHKYLMERGITIVENLANTDKIDFDKEYQFIALPLKLKGLDGSPCRAVIIEK